MLTVAIYLGSLMLQLRDACCAKYNTTTSTTANDYLRAGLSSIKECLFDMSKAQPTKIK